MQTYVVKFKSYKSLEKIPKTNKRRGMFIPDFGIRRKTLQKTWNSLEHST